MNSPWGHVDHQERLAEGVLWVSTPSHGGVRIDTEVVALSEAAKKRGMWHYETAPRYLWFEEDCQYAIAIFELPQTWPKLFREMDEDARAHLLKTLSSWEADYLLERGIEPDPEGFKYWLAMKDTDERRARKDPDLIVAVFGEWDTKRPGVVRVITADDQTYFVTADSYHIRQPNLLSQCVRVQ